MFVASAALICRLHQRSISEKRKRTEVSQLMFVGKTTQLEMASPIVGVGLGETLTEFFRHCPSCGRRFHVYLENKKIVESHMETVRTVAPSGVITRTASKYGPPAVYVATVHEGKPIFLDVEEFQYNYICGHCGHEWSEKHTKEHRMKAGK
jgi:hypothetical protein